VFELKFTNTPFISGRGYVGGPCKIPLEILWPCDDEKNPLYHLISVPLQWLDETQFGQITSERWISIFVPYDKEGYSHYGKMSPDNLEAIDAVVILHDMSGPDRSEHPEQESASGSVERSFVDKGRDLNDIASYIDGVPTWIQDPIELTNYRWVMSLYGPDLDLSLIDNPGILSGGVGYLFLKVGINPDEFGQVGRFYFEL
jgi:hypothetical protein